MGRSRVWGKGDEGEGRDVKGREGGGRGRMVGGRKGAEG